MFFDSTSKLSLLHRRHPFRIAAMNCALLKVAPHPKQNHLRLLSSIVYPHLTKTIPITAINRTIITSSIAAALNQNLSQKLGSNRSSTKYTLLRFLVIPQTDETRVSKRTTLELLESTDLGYASKILFLEVSGNVTAHLVSHATYLTNPL